MTSVTSRGTLGNTVIYSGYFCPKTCTKLRCFVTWQSYETGVTFSDGLITHDIIRVLGVFHWIFYSFFFIFTWVTT